MKPRKKIVIGTTVALVILFITLLGYFVLHSNLAMDIFLNYAIKQSQQRRVLLLCKTEHHALLKAGREILSQVPKDILNPQPNGIRHIGDIGLPSGVDIPQAIRDLKPRGCLVSLDGYLTLEMHGGMDHFGVQIYPEDFKEPEELGSNFKYGDRELLPGLWYYDEGYLYGPEEYDKRIDELIEEHTDNGN